MLEREGSRIIIFSWTVGLSIPMGQGFDWGSGFFVGGGGGGGGTGGSGTGQGGLSALTGLSGDSGLTG